MLGQRRRRWTIIRTALGQCIVFASRATFPANSQCWVNAGLLLGHRLGRWPNSNRALVQRGVCWLGMLSGTSEVQCIVFASRATFPANSQFWVNAGLLLGHRLGRWPNSNRALVQRGVCWLGMLSGTLEVQCPAIIPLSGRGPRVVVSTAAFHARVQGSVPGLGGLKETKNVSSSSTCESQYCGEPLWPRGSVLGLRPPGLKFRILCLEGSVISLISPSSGGSPCPI